MSASAKVLFLAALCCTRTDAADVIQDAVLSKMPQAFWDEQTRLLNVANLPDGRTAQTKVHFIIHLIIKSAKDMGWAKQDLPQPVDSWWGVRFAPKPERFRPPTDLPKSFKHNETAREHGPVCLQPDLSGKATMGSEDCLFIDIVAPANASNLPVMFWIYGGGYNHGSSWEEGFYNSAYLASARNMVIAKVNYRVSALGFFASDYLKDTNKDKTTGNQGLQDQRMGMRWVQENIASFGGDPSRVTIVGESAGAFSINWHLASPASFKYYHQAISMSGTNKNSLFYQEYDDATRFYKDFGTTLGCDGKKLKGKELHKCLLEVPAEYLPPWRFIMNVQDAHDYLKKSSPPPTPDTIPQFASPLFPRMPFGPVIDGSSVGLTADPYDVLMAGKGANVPLIVGSNKDGASIFVPALTMVVPKPGGQLPVTEKTLPVALEWWFDKETVNEILAAYPQQDFVKKSGILGWRKDTERFARILRDYMFMCPNRRYFENWQAKTNDQPVWTYVWSEQQGWFERFAHIDTFHASELNYLFEGWYWLPKWWADSAGGITKEKILAATAIQCYWANFVHNGNPSTNIPQCENTNNAEWTQYTPTNKKFLNLQGQSSMMDVAGATTMPYPDDFTPGSNRCDIFMNATAVWHNLYEVGKEEEQPKQQMSWLQAMQAR